MLKKNQESYSNEERGGQANRKRRVSIRLHLGTSHDRQPDDFRFGSGVSSGTVDTNTLQNLSSLEATNLIKSCLKGYVKRNILRIYRHDSGRPPPCRVAQMLRLPLAPALEDWHKTLAPCCLSASESRSLPRRWRCPTSPASAAECANHIL